MSALWVMPSIDREYGDACIASLRVANILRVDNWAPNPNRGVAASWNLGIDAMRAGGHDWLVIVSESVRFGAAGGTDLEAALDTPVTLVGPCDQTCGPGIDSDGAGYCKEGFGWHLIALHRDAFALVGYFDEVFWPAWWEDTDWMRRLALSGGVPQSRVDGIGAHLVAIAHTLTAGLIDSSWGVTAPYYVKKWGGGDGFERYVRPYDDPNADWRTVTRAERADT